MNIKVIKNDTVLAAALDRLETLAIKNPEPTGSIADEIELLSLVIEDYENKHYSINRPEPLEASRLVTTTARLLPSP